MLKKILVLTGAAFLAACSSGGSTPGTEAVTPPDMTTGDGVRTGAYIGDFGSGNGIYVLSATNELSGLALSEDGSAHSLFANLGAESTFVGNTRSYYHTPSQPAEQGVFGAGDAGSSSPNPAATAFNLNIVDGQTIENLSGNPVSLTAAAAGALSSSSPAAIAGTWTGGHRFCIDVNDLVNGCSVLVTEINFTGNVVSGRTVVLDATGAENFANPIEGSISELGSVSTLTFIWNGMSYSGSVFFLPGSTTQLVFLGETVAVDAGNPTFATILTR